MTDYSDSDVNCSTRCCSKQSLGVPPTCQATECLIPREHVKMFAYASSSQIKRLECRCPRPYQAYQRNSQQTSGAVVTALQRKRRCQTQGRILDKARLKFQRCGAELRQWPAQRQLWKRRRRATKNSNGLTLISALVCFAMFALLLFTSIALPTFSMCPH